MEKRIVIAGGGISGLSAAYYVNKWCQSMEIDANIILVEKSNALGGKIRTSRKDGYVIEQGPDSFLGRKLPIIRLIHELGMESELVGTDPAAKSNYILHDGKLAKMPKGLSYGIPTEVGPFIKTGLISMKGKIRAAGDLFLPRKREAGDEALGSFISRRLGNEVLDQLVEPLLAGIYAGDTESLSLLSTFPQFSEMEQKYRSLILGMLAQKKAPRKTQAAPLPFELPPIVQKSFFLSLRNGLSSLVERLEQELVASGVQIQKGCGVRKVLREANEYRITLENDQSLAADGVILALPSYESYKLLGGLPEADGLEKTPYVTVANVVFGYQKDALDIDLKGSGFVVPRSEGRFITASTWVSSKWPHTAPQDKVLLRGYIGRLGAEAPVAWSDSQLADGVQQELKAIMGIEAQPEFALTTRWNNAMPQYTVGHLERVHNLRVALAKQYPQLLVCGSGYNGVGIPDCIGQGEEVARQLAASFRH